MIEFSKQFPAKVSFLILLLNLFVFSTFGQNTKTPDCKKKFSNCPVPEYTKIIESNPSDAIAYFNRGIAYHVEKKFDESFSDFSKAIELDPKFASAYTWRGGIYSFKKEYDFAIANYNKAIELEPGDASAYSNRGSVYSAIHNYDKALADYSKAVELNPDDWLHYYIRSFIYRKIGKESLANVDLKMAKVLADPKEWKSIIGTELEKKESKKSDALLSLSLAVAQTRLVTFTARGRKVTSLFFCNGNDYTIEFSERDFINTPSWNPEKEVNAPLSIRKALKIARTTLNRCYPKANNWNLFSLQLNPMGENKWVYEIEFECSYGNCANDKYIYATLYIKLDGTVILPKLDAKPTEKLDTSNNPIPSGRP